MCRVEPLFTLFTAELTLSTHRCIFRWISRDNILGKSVHIPFIGVVAAQLDTRGIIFVSVTLFFLVLSLDPVRVMFRGSLRRDEH